MSGIGKALKSVVKVIKKVALPALALAAVVFTGGAALGLAPFVAGGSLAGGMTGVLSGVFGTGFLGTTVTGALVGAANGAALGAITSAVTGGNISKGLEMGIPLGVGFLLVVALMMNASLLLASVAEEKESRVVEIILSSVPADQLLFGKVLGVVAAGLLQIAIWMAMLASWVTSNEACTYAPAFSTLIVG